MQMVNYSIYDLFADEEAVKKASSFFARVKLGQDEVYRTPLFNADDPVKILDNWLSRVEKLKSKTKQCPGLEDFEYAMAEKVGPLSVMKPLKERFDDIKSYYKAIHMKSIPIHPKAIRRYLTKVQRVKIIPWDFKMTTDHMRLSTNSGVPYFARRRKVLYETKIILHNGKFYVAILGWRGQEGGPDVDDIKQRVIWMFPLAVNIRELSVYTPLIKGFQQFNINSAYIGMRAVEEKITKCFDTADDNYVVVTDFSKFDQQIGRAHV